MIMRVILIQNVPNLGKIDDIKEVSEGYGRNFLFAKNLAVPATAKALQDLDARKNRKVKDKENDLREQQALADKLEGREFTIKGRVSKDVTRHDFVKSKKLEEDGSLYAAIGPQKISEVLAKSGFKINKNQIIVKPIKEVGQYQAKIKFLYGLEAEIQIIVSKI